jgi:hypothetical protein
MMLDTPQFLGTLDFEDKSKIWSKFVLDARFSISKEAYQGIRGSVGRLPAHQNTRRLVVVILSDRLVADVPRAGSLIIRYASSNEYIRTSEDYWAESQNTRVSEEYCDFDHQFVRG